MLDQQADDDAKDAITGNIARAARGNDFQIELGFSVTIDDVNTLLDVSVYESVTLTVKAENDRGGVTLMQAYTSTLNNALTPENWNNGTDQHAVIRFTAEETKLDLDQANERRFFWSVRARTVDGTDVTLGHGILIIYLDGVGGETTVTPPLGSSLVPAGQTYSGAGAYVLNGLVAGYPYTYEKGANDTDLVNGTETLTATGWFIAQGASVTLHGTASALITALLRFPRIALMSDLEAKFGSCLKIINAPGVLIGSLSPNGTKLRLQGIDDDKMPIDELIDLTAI